MLVDQGAKDQFLDLLRPEALVAAAAERRQPLQFRMLDGYDHSYFTVASVMADHVRWHAGNQGTVTRRRYGPHRRRPSAGAREPAPTGVRAERATRRIPVE